MALDTRKSKRSMKTRLFLLGFAGVAFAISAPACSLQLQTESDLARMKGCKSVCCRKYDPVAEGDKTTNSATG
jgi:hypothetical protein